MIRRSLTIGRTETRNDAISPDFVASRKADKEKRVKEYGKDGEEGARCKVEMGS
jgi:hypothetical protein